jgi:hypothetical protein
MIYTIIDRNLIIKNIERNIDYSIDISMFKKLESIVADKTGENIAIVNSDENEEKSSIFTYNLGSSNLNEIYNGKATDLFWFSDKSGLLFNSGNSICMIQSNGSDNQKILKFSKIEYSPIMLSLSPDETKFAFIKWKRDNKKLFLYDFSTAKERGLFLSCYDYSWLDDRTIVYNLNDGIKILDVIDNNGKTFIEDICSLRKIEEYYKICGDIEKVLLLGDKDGFIVNSVSKPKCYNGRIYFEIFACTKTSKVIGVLSIDKDLSNLRQHFISEQGLITDYYILDDCTIDVDIKINTLLH